MAAACPSDWQQQKHECIMCLLLCFDIVIMWDSKAKNYFHNASATVCVYARGSSTQLQTSWQAVSDSHVASVGKTMVLV